MKNRLNYFLPVVLLLTALSFTSFGQCTYLPLNGTATPCSGIPISYTTTAVPLKQSYTWQVTGGTIISGQGTPAAQVVWDLTGNPNRWIRISYTDGTCINYTTQKDVVVTPTETPVINPMVTEVCVGATSTFSVAPGKTNYNWVVSAGTISGLNNASSVTIVWNVPGNQSVSVSYNNGACPSFVSTRNVLVNASTTPTITGPAVVCGGTAGHLYTTEPGMTNYSWTIYNGSFTGSNKESTVSANWSNGEGYIKVSYVNPAGCAGLYKMDVSAKYVLNQGLGVMGYQTVCAEDDPTVLSTSGPDLPWDGVFSYQWMQSSLGNGSYNNISGATGPTYDPPVGAVGYYKRLTYTRVNGLACPSNKLSVPVSITRNSVYPGVISLAPNMGQGEVSSQYVCTGDDVSMLYNHTSPSSNVMDIQWQSSLNGQDFTDIAGAKSETYNPPAITANTYFRRKMTSTLNNVTCAAYSNIAVVYVSNKPGVTTTNKTICSGQAVNLSLTSDIEPTTYSWTILSKAGVSGVLKVPPVQQTPSTMC